MLFGSSSIVDIWLFRYDVLNPNLASSFVGHSSQTIVFWFIIIVMGIPITIYFITATQLWFQSLQFNHNNLLNIAKSNFKIGWVLCSFVMITIFDCFDIYSFTEPECIFKNNLEIVIKRINSLTNYFCSDSRPSFASSHRIKSHSLFSF